MKNIRIEFSFTDDEWEDLLEFYGEKQIRQILEAGGNGELSQLIENQLGTHNIKNN